MKCRYKTYAEFLAKIKVAYDHSDVVIACMNNVLYKGIRPWNSAQTRKSFLAKLYIKVVLQKKSVSTKIKRIEGYELLGARYFYKNHEVIVCSASEVVDPDTGEMDVMCTLAAGHRPQPFKLLLSHIKS